MKLYCLGPEKTYSDLVANSVISDYPLLEKEYLLDFADIVERVSEEEGNMGLVVVENSNTSSIHPTVDAIYSNRISIIGEYYLNVRLHLIGRKSSRIDEITHVVSKIEALKQCKRFIRKNNLTEIEVVSTTKGKELLGRNPGYAVIGGKQMLDDSLEILKDNIGDQLVNKTRFLLISSTNTKMYTQTKVEKMSVILSLPHRPGSLADLLVKLGMVGANLTKIESRPIPGTEWEYNFWLDIELQNVGLNSVRDIIDTNSLDRVYLGFYNKGATIES